MSAVAAGVTRADAANAVVYLLDSASAEERRILARWIDEQHLKPPRFETVELQAAQRKLLKPRRDRLSSCMHALTECDFVPLRVIWPVARRDRRSPQVVEGQRATLAELRRQLQAQSDRVQPNPDELADFVRKSAVLALDRAQRKLQGARYKIPRLLASEIFSRPRVRDALQKIAGESARTNADVEREAHRYLAEMAAAHTPAGIDVAAALGRFLYTRAFEADIELAPGDIERIRALMNEKPVAFGSTHKSHIDGFMLVTMFHDHDMTPLHFFGGINMKFLGLGTLMKKGGAIFVRRSFQDNPVYKVVIKNYIDYLGEKRFPLLWALEGTRSRTGKVMPFRFGMINYVVSAYVRDHSPDLVLMPIAVTYDQVPEVSDYDALQAGANKRPESASWFMQYIRRLKRPHGKIHVRFGRGVQLSDFVDAAHETEVSKDAIQKIAFALTVDVNSVMPVTVNSLIVFVMLTHGHQALTLPELVSELEPLRAWLQVRNIPATSDVSNWSEIILDKSLQLLAANGVLRIDTSGLEPVYAVAPGAARMAAYYRNVTVHYFIRGAIAEVSLLAVQSTGHQAMAEFRQSAVQLRELLKFEFTFEEPAAFIRGLERDLDSRIPGWRSAVEQGPVESRNIVGRLPVIFGHGALRPFLEAYRLVAESLVLLSDEQPVDERTLMARSMALGRQRLLQRRIRCEESVSGSYFENAIKLAAERGCLELSAAAVRERAKLLQQLSSAVSKTQVLGLLADSRGLQWHLRA